MNIALASLFHVAQVHDFFRQEGVDVIPQPHITGVAAVQSLIKGESDLAISSDTPFVLAVLNGEQLTMLAMIASSSRYNVIIARKDHGVLVPKNLRGKKIGVVAGSTAHFFLHSFLVANGLSHRGVIIKFYQPGEPIRTALENGDVDAISYWSNAAGLLEQALGDKAVYFYDETLYSDNACLSSKQEFARSHPDAIRKILRALLRAESYIRTHPDTVQKDVAAFTGSEQTVFNKAWETISFRLALDAALLVSLEDQTQWAIRHDLAAKQAMPDYREYMTPDLLRSVKPSVVRLF